MIPILARQGELSLASEILQSNEQLVNALDTEGVNWFGVQFLWNV